MSRRLALRLWLVCLLVALLSGCSRDPNARKQKYFASGQRYFAEGKYAEAEIQYSNAIRIDLSFAQAHYELGQTYLRLGDNNHAFQELTRTVELAPDNYRAHADLANLLITARNPDGSPNADYLKQAKSHLDVLHEKQPNSAETHEAWSNYYAAQNHVSTAILEMQQAIALDPNRSESYLVLGLLQQGAKLTDQAEVSYRMAIDKDPKAMNARLTLGAFYEYCNRLPEAETQFNRAIDVDPKDPAATYRTQPSPHAGGQEGRDRIPPPENQERSSE